MSSVWLVSACCRQCWSDAVVFGRWPAWQFDLSRRHRFRMMTGMSLEVHRRPAIRAGLRTTAVPVATMRSSPSPVGRLFLFATLLVLASCAASSPGQTRPTLAARPGTVHAASDCFPFERLPDPLGKKARDLLLKALDGEALYSIASNIKPMSSGFYAAQVALAQPDLRDPEEVRQIFEAWTCGGEIRASLHHFGAIYEGRRPLEGVVFNLPRFRQMLAAYPAFFGLYGLSPSADPVEALMAVEYDTTTARLRGYGYFFGYPQYAVDFFVGAADEQKKSGNFVARDFLSLPTARGERRFVYATPKGHAENDADREFKAAVDVVFSRYMTRRAKHITNDDSANVLALLREWFDDGRGVVKPSNVWGSARSSTDTYLSKLAGPR